MNSGNLFQLGGILARDPQFLSRFLVRTSEIPFQISPSPPLRRHKLYFIDTDPNISQVI